MSAGKSATEVVGADQVAIRDLIGESRIGFAVSLALGVGGYRHWPRRDRQFGADERKSVVRTERQVALLDRIRSDVFARHAVQRPGERIAVHQVARRYCIGQGRVAVAIHLRLGVGGYSHRASFDCQGRADE